jgi:hypothetical protein
MIPDRIRERLKIIYRICGKTKNPMDYTIADLSGAPIIRGHRCTVDITTTAPLETGMIIIAIGAAL